VHVCAAALRPPRARSGRSRPPPKKTTSSHPPHPIPSFYFVSDPVLLEILSLGSDPPSVVPHLQSGLFDAVASASFDRADPRHRLVELVSPQGEKLRLEGAGVDARGAGAEVWLQRLVDGMRAAVRGSIRRAARDVQALGNGGSGASGGNGAAASFVFGAPAQAALLGLQLLWTADVQGALSAARAGDRAAVGRAFRRADALLRCVRCCQGLLLFFLRAGAASHPLVERARAPRLPLRSRARPGKKQQKTPGRSPTPSRPPPPSKKQHHNNSELVSVTVRSDLTRVQRTSLETCVTVHMHQRESTEMLQRKKVRDPSDFEWQRQVRCYWREVSIFERTRCFF